MSTKFLALIAVIACQPVPTKPSDDDQAELVSTNPPLDKVTWEGMLRFPKDHTGIITAASTYVGYSYWWGHSVFAKGAGKGSCSKGTHKGKAGADCSGFVAKVWQLPVAMPWDADNHPYTTKELMLKKGPYWTAVKRAEMRAGDIFVVNNSSATHTMVYEKDDAWGKKWLLEAAGCDYGITHSVRAVGGEYVARRRTEYDTWKFKN